MKHFLGIDIGGTKCAVCIGDEFANILDRIQISTTCEPNKVLDTLALKAESLLEKLGPVEAIGISCGGPLDTVKGLILSPPNLPGWDSVPVTRILSEHFSRPVFLKNDANAGALAEWKHGAGRGSRNMMFCTMGTGFGAGLILNGRLLEGANGNAGEIGHIRLTPSGPIGYGKAGSVEGWCGGNGIAQVAERMIKEHEANSKASCLASHTFHTAKSIAEAAMQGDALAKRIFAEIGAQLGHALAIAIDLLNLDTIVIGSIFTRSEQFLRPSMQRILENECLPQSLETCAIKTATLGERIGDVAALTVAQLGMEDRL